MIKKKFSQTIGIVGGMGSYATIHFFKKIIDAFPAEKDWERPRIIIDNRCTLPSRVRVFLYKDPEEHEELISSLADSAKGLLNFGADYLVFTCNTAHIFIDEVLDRVPEAREKTVHIIDTLAQDLVTNNVHEAYLLASEGTIDSKIFPKIFDKYEIGIISPNENEYAGIRYFIEKAKQTNAGDDCKKEFLEYCAKLNMKNIILGCTDLPVILEDIEEYNDIRFWDPLSSVIKKVKSVIK